jgi:anaerobic magnesium-protoporphyrin IX monomethyl ester cyclase
MKKDLLLINPPITLEERYGSFASVGSQAPPLGLCYIAATVRQAGYSVQIIDAPTLDMDMPQTIAEIARINAGLIGITASTVSIPRAGELAAAIKQHGITVPILIGGPHVSSLPVETLQEFREFEIGVLNEGEYTVPEIIACYKNGEAIADIQGIVYRRDSDIILSAPRPNIENLDALPLPAWDLIPSLPKYYKPSPHSYHRLPSSTLLTSRGCNGTCTFCARPFMGEKYRSHSAESTLEMIDHLVKVYGIRDIMFYDDNFLLDRKRVTKICEEILRRNYKLSWSCLARTDVMPEDFFKLIKRAGCWQIAYGIESADQGILDNLKKRTTIQKVEEMIHKTNEAGIHSRGYFMIGCPGETLETMAKTTRFIIESGLRDFHVTFCTPMPGAELFKTAEQYGQFERDWKKLGFWEPAFIPAGLTKQDLINNHRKMYRKFYLRPRVIGRYLVKFITSPRSIGSTVSAGLNVTTYGIGGYVRRKLQALQALVPGNGASDRNKKRSATEAACSGKHKSRTG